MGELEATRAIMKLDRIDTYNTEIRPHLPFEAMVYLSDHGFFDAPASTKYHGAYEGGLFDHSMNVTRALVQLTRDNNLVWRRKESPWIIGFFHDLCKTDQYRKTQEGTWEYRKDTLLKGHGDKSVMMLSELTKLTEEEIVCIRYHMGAFCEKEEWGDYTAAIHKWPNVLWTHMADMLAAHVTEVG